MRRPRGQGAGAAESVCGEAQGPPALVRVSQDTLVDSGAPTGFLEPKLLDHWEIWLPARLGPLRRVRVMVAGHVVKTTRRRMELPPGPNGSRGNPIAHSRWVKEWRTAAASTAREKGLPTLARARISVIVYRARMGTADPDNDWARIKPLLDGLRDAGALTKDTHKHLTIGSIEERRGDHGILLIVDELPPPEQARGEGGI